MNPEAKNKVFLLREFAEEGSGGKNLDLSDPIGQPMYAYEKCLHEIKDILMKALPKIIEVLGGN
jgi:hypothetical protein